MARIIPAHDDEGDESHGIHTTTQMPQQPHCCQRLFAELKEYSCRRCCCDHYLCGSSSCANNNRPPTTFSLNDPGTDQIINVPESFAPSGWLVLLWKGPIGAWIFSLMVMGLMEMDHKLFWLAYLTHWSLLVSICYWGFSLFNSLYPGNTQQPSEPTRGPSRRICITWVLYEVAAHSEILIAILYWTLLHVPHTKVRYTQVMLHGIVGFLLLIDGFVINCIPIRLMHWCQFVLWWDVTYLFWTLLHDELAIGNPTLSHDDPSTNDDAIYEVVQWKIHFDDTKRLAIQTLCILSPLVYLTLYGISLLSCCGCSGYNRRYLDHQALASMDEDTEEGFLDAKEENEESFEMV